jgi:TRAP-type C4-dicarboxylate transport system permease large subunit
VTLSLLSLICSGQLLILILQLLVNYIVESHSWDVKFRRNFGSTHRMCWEQLLLLLDPVFLSDQRDTVKWAFDKNGQ